MRDELRFDRPVSVSSNSLFRVLPRRLPPFGLLFCIIFGILLFILVACRSQFDLYLRTFFSSGPTFNSSGFSSFLYWFKKKVSTRLCEVHSVTPHTQTPASTALTKEALRTVSQRYNCPIIRRGNAAEHGCPEDERWQPHHWTT
jgi:hypothetical protein